MPIGDGLQEKLRKIEALYAGAGAPGEIQFSLGDEWSRRLFLALCRRCGLDP